MTQQVPQFSAPYAEADETIARALLEASLPEESETRIGAQASRLIEAIRAGHGRLGDLEDFLRVYSLSTEEGLALMGLAEALLRVPDSATADDLIEDKLSHVAVSGTARTGDPLLVSASAWALGVTSRLIQPGRTPESLIQSVIKRLGLPAVRTATRQAMRMLGHHFVLGETIEDALARARSPEGQAWRYSFDMLGEGARTARDATLYWEAYANAIEAIGADAGEADAGEKELPERPGISVKLSALHPRFTALDRDRVLKELPPRLLDLARAAKHHDLNFTVDAEEADRLELSLEVIAATLCDTSLSGWNGFGLAVQAYQKRAAAVIGWCAECAQALNRRLTIRLVKGAYWDTEIKRAQERGLAGYPVFTRKAMTDLNYEACARQLLGSDRLYPQFATHNALTVATVLELAGSADAFEFQRLHGMGETLYTALRATRPETACRVYAPVGGHRDLLAYLVRRLLENGANSSFVSAAADPAIPPEKLLTHPHRLIGTPEQARHASIPLPRDLYAPLRENASGVELGHRASLTALLDQIAAARIPERAAPIMDGRDMTGPARPVRNPADGTIIGEVVEGDGSAAHDALEAAQRHFPAWSATPADTRAQALERAADLLEERRAVFLKLLQTEAGKTIDDAIAELREAVDFCRYYAARARLDLQPELMPGPTGEENRLQHRGRGVFICISPWNFPLAIFLGQIAAALVAGNSVVAKPAPQTPLIATAAIRLLHEAGIPAGNLHLVPGGPKTGAALVEDARVAGVAFTGSTQTAWAINRALAAKDGPIVPLIAETGGINAMIVDATALPEQVADDVITSAFRSAGQRCSALRLLFVQEDVAGPILDMIEGAARELAIGDPRDPGIQIGPVIDEAARQRLERHVEMMRATQKIIYAGQAPPTGTFVGPHIVELDHPGALREEVFGPILHVVRWKTGRLDEVIASIQSTGYGLTLGIHSRIEAVARHVTAQVDAGNIYINRNMIGAVVGTQPFGGSRLSGTGPKAGGPGYLRRFASEQVVTVNTAAAGGNASLVAIPDR